MTVINYNYEMQPGFRQERRSQCQNAASLVAHRSALTHSIALACLVRHIIIINIMLFYMYAVLPEQSAALENILPITGAQFKLASAAECLHDNMKTWLLRFISNIYNLLKLLLIIVIAYIIYI